MTDKLLVDELANELRQYRHSQMGSGALAEHILAIPRIHDAATISNKRIAELEEALAKVRRYALAGEGPTFDLILAVTDAALNTKETDRGE